MIKLSDHVYISEDRELGCVRNNDNKYVVLFRQKFDPLGVYETLKDAQDAIREYENLSEEARLIVSGPENESK